MSKWEKWTSAKIASVVYMREAKKMTYREIGEKLHLSAARIRQVYAVELRRQHGREFWARIKSETV